MMCKWSRPPFYREMYGEIFIHQLPVKMVTWLSVDNNISEYGKSLIVIMKWARKLSTMVLDTNLATGMFPTPNFMGINKGLTFYCGSLSIPACT